MAESSKFSSSFVDPVAAAAAADSSIPVPSSPASLLVDLSVWPTVIILLRIVDDL